jgi:xanthine dehydrogenase accessory factor
MTFLPHSFAAMHHFGLKNLSEDTPFVLIEIVSLEGSAPRGKGVQMLVSAQKVVGTIGGGHLEFVAIDHAQTVILSGSTLREVKSYALGPSLGQCCGGRVGIAYERVNQSRWAAIEHQLLTSAKARFTLNIFGAGHVGAALTRALAPLPCLVNWIDEREDLFAAATETGVNTKAANIRQICVDSPAAEVALASPGDFYLVLTHSHALDLAIVEAVLRRADAGYLGLIGSATKRASFESRLHRLGLTTTGLHCPVGLAGLTGKEPEVIAASIAADLLLRSSVSR